jgi:hypothetical protein
MICNKKPPAGGLVVSFEILLCVKTHQQPASMLAIKEKEKVVDEGFHYVPLYLGPYIKSKTDV